MTIGSAVGVRSIAQSRLIRATLGLSALVLGISSVVSHGLEYRGVERFSKDFALDYSSAKAVVHGEDPYARIRDLVDRYLHPPPDVLERNILPGANWHTPFKLIVTLPLTALPYRAAGVVWLLLCAACFVGAGFFVGREIGWSLRSSLLLGVGSLAVPVVQTDLSAGNLNGPMLLLLVVAWRSLERKRPLWCGAALGILIALKFFPAFLALPLLARRRFREVASAAAISLVLTLVGAAVLGSDHAGSFLSAGGGDEGFAYWDQSPANISWWGMATRWLTPSGWVHAGVDAPEIGVVLAVGGVVLFVALMLKSGSRPASEQFLASAPLMLLAWPITWIHYLVLVLPWVMISKRRLVSSSAGPAVMTLFGLTALALMVGFLPGTPSLDQAGTLDVALAYQIPTAALIGAVLLDRFFSRQARRVASVSAR